jgi:hypothetical protein
MSASSSSASSSSSSRHNHGAAAFTAVTAPPRTDAAVRFMGIVAAEAADRSAADFNPMSELMADRTHRNAVARRKDKLYYREKFRARYREKWRAYYAAKGASGVSGARPLDAEPVAESAAEPVVAPEPEPTTTAPPRYLFATTARAVFKIVGAAAFGVVAAIVQQALDCAAAGDRRTVSDYIGRLLEHVEHTPDRGAYRVRSFRNDTPAVADGADVAAVATMLQAELDAPTERWITAATAKTILAQAFVVPSASYTLTETTGAAVVTPAAADGDDNLYGSISISCGRIGKLVVYVCAAT